MSFRITERLLGRAILAAVPALLAFSSGYACGRQALRLVYTSWSPRPRRLPGQRRRARQFRRVGIFWPWPR
jgi:hypothetical protein